METEPIRVGVKRLFHHSSVAKVSAADQQQVQRERSCFAERVQRLGQACGTSLQKWEIHCSLWQPNTALAAPVFVLQSSEWPDRVFLVWLTQNQILWCGLDAWQKALSSSYTMRSAVSIVGHQLRTQDFVLGAATVRTGPADLTGAAAEQQQQVLCHLYEIEYRPCGWGNHGGQICAELMLRLTQAPPRVKPMVRPARLAPYGTFQLDPASYSPVHAALDYVMFLQQVWMK